MEDFNLAYELTPEESEILSKFEKDIANTVNDFIFDIDCKNKDKVRVSFLIHQLFDKMAVRYMAMALHQIENRKYHSRGC